ncbi:MAG: hypothetical protein V3V01_01015 [Acidimicrobiales bacterium]
MFDDPYGPLYSVVCTDTNPYGTWQVEFLEHTWRRADMPGELIRLVGTSPDELLPLHRTAHVVRTAAKNTHPLAELPYAGFNRLYSLAEWLDTERPVGSVLILDSDFAFRAPIHLRANPGEVIVQHWWDFGVSTRIDELLNEISPVGGPFPPATWPMIFHTSDLRRIMPRWLEITALLKQEQPAFWEADMFAFVAVLREEQLEIRYETLGAWMPWPEDAVAGAPIVHYCQPVKNEADETIWYKQQYTPWEPLDCNPDDAALDYCRDLLHMFDHFAESRRARPNR